jgi:hypothetical protein
MHFCGEKDRVVVLVSGLFMYYVRHAQRLETPDGQRRGSHQDDQGDSSVDGRTNDSNAEMMINAIRPRTFF